MDIIHSEWKVRINNWIAVLKRELYMPIGEITWEAFRTQDYLTPEQAAKADFEPVRPGYTWGEAWEYCWFRAKVTLPEGVDGKRIVMNLAPGGESTLFVNGKKYETKQADKIFTFKVRIKGKVKIRAISGECSDEITIRRAEVPNPSYKLNKKVANGGNWT